MPEQFINVKSHEKSEEVKKEEACSYGSSINISNSSGDICRICHCEADIDNPLLSPCYCSGSLKYVHQSCLQQWLASSDTRSCELCKFNFILHTKIKPIGEWRTLEMTTVERRRLLCAILFHFVAAVCVMWSLFVLIDRATEEVQKGLIAWPFWTKLVVVAVGFTGGAVFMYIQCRQYLQLFSRWKAHNRIILVQNAPDNVCQKIAMVSSTSNYNTYHHSHVADVPPQVNADVECSVSPCYPADIDFKNDGSLNSNYDVYSQSFTSSIHKRPFHSHGSLNRQDLLSVDSTSFDALELNIQEVLALDVLRTQLKGKVDYLPTADGKSKTKNKNVFVSLPNLSASNENLLM